MRLAPALSNAESSRCTCRPVVRAWLHRYTRGLGARQLAPAKHATARGGEAATREDPFTAAGVRLQRLVDDSSWDGGEAIRQELLELPIASRLTFFINISCIPLAFAMILNIITNEDIFGGMTLSQDSLAHALQGIGYALPLLATSLLGRAPRVRRMFPVLEALHDVQEKVMEPMVKGLDGPQLLIVCLTATLPWLLFMLPAVHGSMLVLGSLLQSDLLSPAGVHVPGSIGRELSALLPAMGSSYLAAFIVAKQLAVKRGQYHAIHTAITNSDRYYRLTESMAAQTGDSSQRSREVSEAFKIVSTMWVVMRRKVSQLSFILTALNVCYLAMIWHDTNDLSTPFAAALLAFGFEMLLSRRALMTKERARQRLREEWQQQERA